MAEWEVALERQVATWAFTRQPKGAAFFDSYKADVASKYPDQAYLLGDLRGKTEAIIGAAEPIYVTKEMCHLIESAWHTFAPEPLREDDLFLPAGFAYLAEPLVTTDVWGKRMVHRAIAWHVGTDPDAPEDQRHVGVHVMTFAGAEDARHDDYFQGSIRERSGYVSRFNAHFGRALALGHATPIRFGQVPGQQSVPTILDTDNRPTDEAIRQTATEFHAYLQVLWRMMGQRIAVGIRARASRATRRQVEREGWRENYVTLVTLRRPRGEPSGDHRSVDWAQRWIVSGHWRWQPYKDGTHRQIWISPYVKGPEDKPLVVRGARVFRLAR